MWVSPHTTFQDMVFQEKGGPAIDVQATDGNRYDAPCFPDALVHELATLRLECAEHNKRLLDMVQRRLDKMAERSIANAAPRSMDRTWCSAGSDLGSTIMSQRTPVVAWQARDGNHGRDGPSRTPALGVAREHTRWSQEQEAKGTYSENLGGRLLALVGLTEDDWTSDEHRYKAEGFCQEVVRSTLFQWVTMAVIGINAFWIGWAVDNSIADTLPDEHGGFQLVENMFCFFFVFEVVVRYGAYQRKVYALIDAQFMFDCFLCVPMVIETWLVYIFAASNSGINLSGAGFLSILRMLRLTRMARLMRIFRFIPELMVLIKGVSVALKSMMWTSVFLFLIIYVFAICFRMVSDETEMGKLHFPSIPSSMAFLLLPGLFPDNAAYVFELGATHIAYALLLVVFIVLGTLVVMNMLIGLMCEGVSAVAAAEKEDLAMMRLNKNMQKLIARVDEDSDGTISRAEISSMLHNADACDILQEVGVPVQGFVDVADFYIFGTRDSVSIREFSHQIWQLRDGNAATVRDVVELRRFVTDQIKELRTEQIRDGSQRRWRGARKRAPTARQSELDWSDDSGESV